jgi:hypothetical protein
VSALLVAEVDGIVGLAHAGPPGTLRTGIPLA